jgi:hypothetical protein
LKEDDQHRHHAFHLHATLPHSLGQQHHRHADEQQAEQPLQADRTDLCEHEIDNRHRYRHANDHP